MITVTDRFRAATVEGYLADADQIEFIGLDGEKTTVSQKLEEINMLIDYVVNTTNN